MEIVIRFSERSRGRQFSPEMRRALGLFQTVGRRDAVMAMARVHPGRPDPRAEVAGNPQKIPCLPVDGDMSLSDTSIEMNGAVAQNDAGDFQEDRHGLVIQSQ